MKHSKLNSYSVAGCKSTCISSTLSSPYLSLSYASPSLFLVLSIRTPSSIITCTLHPEYTFLLETQTRHVFCPIFTLFGFSIRAKSPLAKEIGISANQSTCFGLLDTFVSTGVLQTPELLVGQQSYSRNLTSNQPREMVARTRMWLEFWRRHQ